MRGAARGVRLSVAFAALAVGAAALVGQGGCALVVGADFDDKTLRGPCASCYSGPEQTLGRGVCVGGCEEGGACVGEITPATERCETPGDDDNCDGVAACDGEPVFARQFGDWYDQETSRVVVGGDGNVVLAVRAQGEVDYGGGPRGLPQTPGLEEYNVHVAKLDARGNHLWSKSFGDGNQEAIFGLAADGQGNVVLAGWFAGAIDFGDGVMGSDAGSLDAFVAKLDPAGEPLWSRRYGDASNQYSLRAAVGVDGSVVVVGGLEGAADFGGGVVGSAGSVDIFILKLDPAGNYLWSRQFGDAAEQYVTDVALGPSGEIAITGHFRGAVDFGGGAISDADGNYDGFVVELDAAGEHRWTRHVEGALACYGIAMDAQGDLFVAGHFGGTMQVGGATLDSAGANDVFLLSYGSDGTPRFAKRFGDGSEQIGLTVEVDDVGAVLLGGYGSGVLDFGITPVPSAGDTDAFVAKLDHNGVAYWARYFGGPGTQATDCIAPDRLGDVLVTGSNDGTIALGAEAPTTMGARDTWLARLRP